MTGKFFRAPGAKVSYTGYETRNYVSRKARVSRGYYISPTRRDRIGDGWRFWFFSPRGPAEDRGNWRVDVVRAEGDGDGDGGDDGGGDGGGGTLPACPPVGTALDHTWVGWHYLDFDFTLPPPYYTTGSGSGTMPQSVAQSISPPGSYVAEGGGYSEGPFFYAPWYWYSDDGDSGWSGETVYYYGTNPNVDLAAEWAAWKADDRYVTPGFVLTTVSGGDFYLNDPNGLPSPYCDDGSTPPPDPDPGGGGTAPPGFLLGEGPWAYACSCPDYTGEESPYRVATAPSHRKARSWGQIRPESPCKHIVSAARALADQKTLVKWVRTFRTDSPGREFTASPTVAVDRNYYKAQREMEAAFRRTARATGRARAAENKRKRAERSARALSNRLGRLWRLNSDGTTTSSSKKGRYGEILVGNPIDWAAIENTDTARISSARSANVDEFIERNGRIEPLDGIPSVADLFPPIAVSSEFTPKDAAAIRYVRRSNR